MKTKLLFLLLALGLLAAGCTASAERFQSENVTGYIDRFVDTDYGIVCYTKCAAISCVKK